MNIPERHLRDAAALPPVLRALLEAELAAGNEIVAVTHSQPAPPIGSCFQLARPITTRPLASGDGLKFRAVNSSLYAGQFTDADGEYFLLEPPPPPPPEPDMDAVRNATNTARPKPKREFTADTPYLINLDYKGEELTYRERDRHTHLPCSFGRKAVLVPRSFSDWWYPREQRSQPMTLADRELVLQRLIDYCHREQSTARVELEDWPEPGQTQVTGEPRGR